MLISVIVAHPDDEVLGCGGTIARHVEQGDIVNLLALSDGVSSRGNNSENSIDIAERHSALLRSAQILNINKVVSLDYPDNQFDIVPRLDIIKSIEEFLGKNEYDIVYTHCGSDLNIDHRITYESVLTACRPQPNKTINQIRTFETVSSTEWALHSGSSFKPNLHIDISYFFDKKISALQAYITEMREAPHSRSFENISALAKYRGMSVGFKLAESFYVERYLIK